MNIDSTTISTATKTTSTSSGASSTSSSTNPSDTPSTSFKEELDSVKDNSTTKETKTTDEAKATKDSKETDSSKSEETGATNPQNMEKTAAEQNAQQLAKDKLTNENTKKNGELINIQEYSDTIKELNSKIATINELKNNTTPNSKIQSTSAKSDGKVSKDYCQTIKMDNNDATFFVNLVSNQQMTAQAQNNQTINQAITNNFTEIKSEATQKSVQISQTLLDAINKSAQTGKSFRVDFDNDIAVVMRVDSKGVLSANFIPGSAAVENYLRNNIEGLKQSFDNQNLQYNELSYSQQQKQNRDQQDRNNKENKDE